MNIVEQLFSSSFLFTLLGVVVLVALYLRYRFPLEWSVFYYNKLRTQTDLSRKDYLRIHRFLRPRVSYYNKMNNRGKARFINRLVHVQQTKKFIGMEGMEVTDEIKSTVSAAIVQLTFGLDKYFLKHYTKVFIYPKAFYNPVLKKPLRGGTTPKGSILLSWEHTVEGFVNHKSKMNVALHEMAHALKLESLEGGDFDHKFGVYLNRWLKISESEFQSMKDSPNSFLRKYASTNRHEFFAVCVEHFFEAPAEFQKALPDIFNHMCFLLNQNPINLRGNYALTKAFKERVNQDDNLIPLPRWVVRRRLKKKYKRRRWIRKKKEMAPENQPIAAQTADDQP